MKKKNLRQTTLTRSSNPWIELDLEGPQVDEIDDDEG